MATASVRSASGMMPIQITLKPGAHAGDLARVALTPPVEYYTLDNRVETVAAGARKLQVVRETGSRQMQWLGAMPLADRGRTEWLAIDDPAFTLFCVFATGDPDVGPNDSPTLDQLGNHARDGRHGYGEADARALPRAAGNSGVHAD